MVTDPMVTAALQDFNRACGMVGASWALIGGQALVSYGIPRYTEDADGLVDADRAVEVAQLSVDD